MNVRWLWLDFFPDSVELTGEERTRLRRELRRRGIGMAGRVGEPASSGAGVAMVIPAVASFWMFLVIGVMWWRPVPVSWAIGLIAVVVVLEWVSLAYVMQRMNRPRLIRALREAGHDLCVRCGYSLAGLPEEESRCPECGAARDRLAAVGGRGWGAGEPERGSDGG